MRWNELPSMLGNLYGTFAEWSFRNEVELDVVVVVTVIGIIALLYKEQRVKRRRLHRLFWGMLMKRKDREKFQLMRFEDSIVDAAMEMVHTGDMTEAQERAWFIFFSEKLGMMGLRPQKNVKRSISERLKFKQRFGLLPVHIPGGPPEVTVDETYQPKEKKGLALSKFLSPKW